MSQAPEDMWEDPPGPEPRPSLAEEQRRAFEQERNRVPDRAERPFGAFSYLFRS